MMRRAVLVFACLVIGIGISAGQGALNEGQGHPLKGVWIGDWGLTKAARNPVVIEIGWDGKVISGTINPGPDAVKFTKADLDPTNWSVHIEAAKYVIDGRIENIGSLSRTISGTWMQGNQKGDFKVTKQ